MLDRKGDRLVIAELAMGRKNNLFVADSGNHVIREIAKDGSVSTVWNSGKYSPLEGAEATLTATLSGPTAVAAISVNVDGYNPVSPNGISEISVSVTVVDAASGGLISLGKITQLVPKGGDMFVFPLLMPATIKQIQVQLNSKQTALAIYEVGYRTCK